jgi:hypothetical protein
MSGVSDTVTEPYAEVVERVPTLRAVLACAKGRIALLLDLNSSGDAFDAQVIVGFGSRTRFAPPLVRFTPDSLSDSVPLFLKRQCDRTLRAGRRGGQSIRRLRLGHPRCAHRRRGGALPGRARSHCRFGKRGTTLPIILLHLVYNDGVDER